MIASATAGRAACATGTARAACPRAASGAGTASRSATASATACRCGNEAKAAKRAQHAKSAQATRSARAGAGTATGASRRPGDIHDTAAGDAGRARPRACARRACGATIVIALRRAEVGTAIAGLACGRATATGCQGGCRHSGRRAHGAGIAAGGASRDFHDIFRRHGRAGIVPLDQFIFVILLAVTVFRVDGFFYRRRELGASAFGIDGNLCWILGGGHLKSLRKRLSIRAIF
ncbi:hypothetical protein D3C71_1334520 [compost metagenome]